MDAMEKLLELYAHKIVGTISGWDRIRFRGTIRWLASTRGLNKFMGEYGLLLKDFGNWAESITNKVRACCRARAEELGIPQIYLRQSGVDKEALARKVAGEHGIDTGPICMLSVVEPCQAPLLRGDRQSKHLHLEVAPRKCVFIYQYWNHPVLGFGHTRLQTWLPLSATVCINGRHWLERQLLAENIAHVKDGNCFPAIADWTRAQELLDSQLRTNWPALLHDLLLNSCPLIDQVIPHLSGEYHYWSADETEWATDIAFASTSDLEGIYPSLLRHALVSADSRAVMRFFGRKVTERGRILGRAPQEVVSDHRTRYEGVRLKHWLNSNSIKAYNKAGNLLRLETTINNPRDFKVFRPANDDESAEPSWQSMRKGVSDLHRRAQVSQACNERYGDHLASAAVTGTLEQLAGELCAPARKNGRRFRALNPWASEDFNTLRFLARGENTINGFRNRDLREYLYPQATDGTKPDQVRRLSGRVTRRLSLLRAHGLIRKVPRTTRYVLTAKGQQTATAILAASAAETQQLMEMAA
jgi:hypothetical protein